MKGTKITGLNLDAFAKDLMKVYIQEQNNRLIEYAKETIVEIGNTIKTYQSKHNMDRTGNLLNSLCWGVTYKNDLIGSGFYREAQTKSVWIGDGYYSESFLHEFFGSQIFTMYPVNGRQLAEEYIQKNSNTGSRGWKVFFAILAPYWGYWEKGFTLTHGGSVSSSGRKNGRLIKGYKGIRGATFMRFAVMAQFYDKVRKDLKPAKKYYFNVSLPPKIDYQKALRKSQM